MKQQYQDIIEAFDSSPKWFDEHGVPRNVPFHPQEVADVYAREVALVRVRCQGCGTVFLVAVSWAVADGMDGIAKLSKEPKGIEYGDPPNVGCCSTGPTMTSVPIRIVQFWQRRRDGWRRDATKEVDCEPEWVKDAREH